MKRILVLLLLVMVILMLFACDFSKAEPIGKRDCTEHIWGEYKYNELVHWREYTCGCPWPEIVEEHINYDADLFCDICGAYVGPEICLEHIDQNGDNICDNCSEDVSDKMIAKWYYTDKGHWMAYDGSKGPVIDIVWAQGEHTFEGNGVKCDKCPYCRHQDLDENNCCDVCGEDLPLPD